ncbi:MAG: PilZ domain-containing protein [Leptospirales bacterium]
MGKSEKRKYPRVMKDFRINYAMPGSSHTTSKTYDISACGLSFESEKVIKNDAVIKLHLKSSATDTHELIGLSLIAKIVRHEKNGKGYRIGAEFMYVTKKTMDLLEVYLYPESE